MSKSLSVVIVRDLKRAEAWFSVSKEKDFQVLGCPVRALASVYGVLLVLLEAPASHRVVECLVPDASCLFHAVNTLPGFRTQSSLPGSSKPSGCSRYAVSSPGSTPCRNAVLMSMCCMSQFSDAARCINARNDSIRAVGAVVLSESAP